MDSDAVVATFTPFCAAARKASLLGSWGFAPADSRHLGHPRLLGFVGMDEFFEPRDIVQRSLVPGLKPQTRLKQLQRIPVVFAHRGRRRSMKALRVGGALPYRWELGR